MKRPNHKLRSIAWGLLAIAALLAVMLIIAPERARKALRAVPAQFRGEQALQVAVFLRDHEGRALASVLANGAKSRLEAVDIDTVQGVLGALQNGAADLALAPAVVTGAVPEERLASLRVVGMAGERLLHLLAPTDSGLTSYAQLAGKRIGAGLNGSAEEWLLRRLLEAAPLNPAPQIVLGHNLDLEQAFLDGEIDAGLLLRPLPSPEVTALVATGYYRLLPVAVGAAAIWGIPEAHLAALPAQVYTQPGMATAGDAPVPTLGVPLLLLARDDLPDFLAGEVAMALQTAMRRTGAKDARIESLPTGLRLHPGAAAAYERTEPVTREVLGTLYYFFAGVVAAVLIALAATRIRRQSRQGGQINTLHALVLRGRELEVAFAEAASEELPSLRARLLALDDDAEQAWLAGEIEASDLLMMRLGWSAELPPRPVSELRARASALAAAPANSTPSTVKLPDVGAARPPASTAPVVRSVARVEPEVVDDEDDDFLPEAPKADAPPAAVIPADSPVDEYGSGALINTIRVRPRHEEKPQPERRPEPSPKSTPPPARPQATRGARSKPAPSPRQVPQKRPLAPNKRPPESEEPDGENDGNKPQLRLF